MTKKKVKNKLDVYELEILDRYESGKMEKSPVSESLVTAAQATILKNKNPHS